MAAPSSLLKEKSLFTCVSGKAVLGDSTGDPQESMVCCKICITVYLFLTSGSLYFNVCYDFYSLWHL